MSRNKLFVACIVMVGIVGSLTGCPKEFIKVPEYQEIVIVDQAAATPLELKNPELQAITGKQLSELTSRYENVDKIFYFLTSESITDWLSDDVDKLEYSQYEHNRAEYYKNAIKDFNDKVKERNAESAKKNK